MLSIDLLNGAGKFTEAFPDIPDPLEEDKAYMYQNDWFMVSPDAYTFE